MPFKAVVETQLSQHSIYRGGFIMVDRAVFVSGVCRGPRADFGNIARNLRGAQYTLRLFAHQLLTDGLLTAPVAQRANRPRGQLGIRAIQPYDLFGWKMVTRAIDLVKVDGVRKTEATN